MPRPFDPEAPTVPNLFNALYLREKTAAEIAQLAQKTRQELQDREDRKIPYALIVKPSIANLSRGLIVERFECIEGAVINNIGSRTATRDNPFVASSMGPLTRQRDKIFSFTLAAPYKSPALVEGRFGGYPVMEQIELDSTSIAGVQLSQVAANGVLMASWSGRSSVSGVPEEQPVAG